VHDVASRRGGGAVASVFDVSVLWTNYRRLPCKQRVDLTTRTTYTLAVYTDY